MRYLRLYTSIQSFIASTQKKLFERLQDESSSHQYSEHLVRNNFINNLPQKSLLETVSPAVTYDLLSS